MSTMTSQPDDDRNQIKPQPDAATPKHDNTDPVTLPSDIDAIEHAKEFGSHRDLDDVGPDEMSTMPDAKDRDPDFDDPIHTEPISTRIEGSANAIVVEDEPEEVLQDPAIDPRGWDHDDRTFLEKLEDVIRNLGR